MRKPRTLPDSQKMSRRLPELQAMRVRGTTGAAPKYKFDPGELTMVSAPLENFEFRSCLMRVTAHERAEWLVMETLIKENQWIAADRHMQALLISSPTMTALGRREKIARTLKLHDRIRRTKETA